MRVHLQIYHVFMYLYVCAHARVRTFINYIYLHK